MRVSIPATKAQIEAVKVELRALGAVHDKLTKAWRIDQHLVYDALEIIERGPSAALRAVKAAERGDAVSRALTDDEDSAVSQYQRALVDARTWLAVAMAAVSQYRAENGLYGDVLQDWQVAEALRIHAQ